MEYTTVAMLRSCVVYVTPIVIHDATSSGEATTAKPTVTIPSFGKHSISDRIIYGPSEAVKIWASERFSRLETHIQYVQEHIPGWGMHSERFLNKTLFPAIREITHIRQHPTMCFLGARADESVWVSDCEGPASVSAPSIRQALGNDMRLVVERTIGRKCPGAVKRLSQNVKYLDCLKGPSVNFARMNSLAKSYCFSVTTKEER
jgi:hypothetical protein